MIHQPVTPLLLLLFMTTIGCDDNPPSTSVVADASPDGQAMTQDMGVSVDMIIESDIALPIIDRSCDPLMPQICSLPWPSNLFLRSDQERVTGYTLTFDHSSLPQNSFGNHIDPEPLKRMDGYGLGTPIMVTFPNIDTAAMPSEYDIEASLAEDASILLFEVSEINVQRVPYWVELDAREPDLENKIMLVRPAVILEENTRYIVAFRALRNVDGGPIVPSEAFALLRDGLGIDEPSLAERQTRFDQMFAELDTLGIDRGQLTLAWDFHTASSDALHGPMRHMWQHALQQVGDNGPPLIFDEVQEYSREEDGSGHPVNPFVALTIKGHIEVPHYMKQDTEFEQKRGWVFNRDESGVIVPNGTRSAPFWISIPHSALTGEAHGLIKHGHGMFGDGRDVVDLGWTRPCGTHPPRECGWYHGRMDDTHKFITFASDLIGMSAEDRDEYALTLIIDLSRFTWIADRLHQGMLEYLLVTRAMKMQLGGMPELMARGIEVDNSELYYWGISQGAIFGPTFMALSPDVTRGALGVAGNNYAMLMERSRNFTPFFTILSSAYQARSDQLIAEAAIQLLWDGTDGISYLRRVTSQPFEGHVAKHMLVDVARGDHQVATVTTENAARSTIGLPILENYDTERIVPLAETVPYPHVGNGLVNWSFGNPWAPAGNQPPSEDTIDPHSSARHMDAHQRQLAHFFRTGTIIDVCDAAPCPNWQAPQEMP
jgi:hypothetical protein